jgi:hypothetical protein
MVLYFDSEIEKCKKNCNELFEMVDISGTFKTASVKIKENTIWLSNNKIAFPVFCKIWLGKYFGALFN